MEPTLHLFDRLPHWFETQSLITRDQPHRGIKLMLMSIFFFSILNLSVKLLGEHYSTVEVCWARSVFGLIPVLFMVGCQGGVRTLKSKRFPRHVLRAMTGISSMLLFFLSFHLLPMADATAINFSNPLFIALFASLWLKEPVGLKRGAAIFAGFLGVLIMIQPSGGLSPTALQGNLAGLSAAVLQALSMLGIRSLGKTEPVSTTTFYFTALSALFISLPLPWFWQTPDMAGFGLMLLAGFSGGIGQILMTRAYQYASGAVISPFGYASIFWATLYGWAVWGELPPLSTYIGGVVVIMAGLFILHHESKLSLPQGE